MPAVILSPIFQVNIYLTDFIIRPPVYGSNGRTYKMLVMFFFSFFNSPPLLRAPSTDRRETWPHDRKLAEFYNAGPKIRGALPHKKFGGQNMQNFGRFYKTNLRLRSRISPERLKISKIRKLRYQEQFLPRSKKKSQVNLGPLITEILM